MKKRRIEFELFFLVAVIALAALSYHRSQQAPFVPNLTWEEHFERGSQAAKLGDLELAELHLLRCRGLGKTFPPGDDRLARSLDMLGYVYFNADQYQRSMHHQADAVAALLLARGPGDSRVEGWAKRYLWAKSRTEDGLSFRNDDPLAYPHQFVATYRPLTSAQRHQMELKFLTGAYKLLGDHKALASLQK